MNLPADAGDLRPGQTIGKCRVEREIGRGGMGAVYLAHHTTLDVPVALKILPPHVAKRDPGYAERFLREARMAARLRHPNVVAVMDADRDEATGLYYIVEEYIDGGSMAERLGKGPIPEAKALAVVAAIARALQAATKQGIIHRDIKPDNILLTKDGRVKLADLGLAKVAGETEFGVTQSSTAIGTPHYMSPEQIQNAKHVDIRSDLWSLGATMFHLMTGKPPFPGNQVFEVIHRVMSDPTPDPRSLRPGIGESTARLCMKMLEKDLARRYQTPTELLADIQRGGPSDRLELEPVAGAAPPPPPQARSEVVLSQGPVDLTESAGTGATAALRKIQPAWVIAGCAILMLLIAIRLMTKTTSAPADAGVRTAANPEEPATASSPAADPARPAADPVRPPADTPPADPPPVRSTLADGCLLALSFEPETAAEYEGRPGWRNLSPRLYQGSVLLAVATNTTSEEGRTGQAIRFGGDDSYLSLPAFEERSVAAWLRPDAPRQAVWYDGGGSSRLEGFLLGLAHPGQFGWALETDAAFVGFWQLEALFPDPSLAEGWHHVAVSWDGARALRLAIDGKLVNGMVADRRAGPRPAQRPRPGPQPLTLPDTPRPKSDYTVVGRCTVKNNPGLAAFQGLMDELAVWDRALSEEELAELWRMAEKGLSYCEEIERSGK
ncbi:MAG: protein kinase [Planctomycetes bacterium]|nr:protein kinase [Planctomycetota bacterium]